MDVFTKQKRSRIMASIRSKNTKPERVVRKLLHGLGYRFRLHKKDLPGKPDIVLSRHKAIIFVNGCFWHGHSCRKGGFPSSNKSFWAEKIRNNKLRDKQIRKQLKVMGWRVLIMWQCQLKNDKRIKDKLLVFLSGDSPQKSTKKVR